MLQVEPLPPWAADPASPLRLSPTRSSPPETKKHGEPVTRERRSQTRETPQPLGFIQINRDDGGRIRNISETGLCFEAFAPIERERLLQFWFSLDLRERVEAKGRLAWLDPRREIGGLQFLDLSPKARRHLRTFLGALANPQPTAPAASQPVALRETNSASRLAADFRAYAQQSRPEEPAGKPRGSAFLKALAKHALGEPALSLQPVEASVPAEPGTQPEYSRSEGTADLPAGPSESRASFNPLAFVSLERHLTKARKQLLRGVVLGIAIGSAAGWFLGRQNVRSPSPSAVLSTAQDPTAPPPTVEVPAATAAPGSATPLTARSAYGRFVADNPPRIAVPPPSSSSFTPASARPRTQGTASPHDDVAKPVSSPADGAKAAKKSTATPQQLWASVQAGNMKAAVELADRFIRGDGVPTNCDQARVLLLVASEKKNADAIKKLHDLDKTGCPPQ